MNLCFGPEMHPSIVPVIVCSTRVVYLFCKEIVKIIVMSVNYCSSKFLAIYLLLKRSPYFERVKKRKIGEDIAIGKT
jgi:hypothetical protein